MSVDAFVEHRSDFLDIGKAALACALLPYESNDLFGEKYDAENWYAHVFKSMNAKIGAFHLNKVHFITFNYDRSLEHYFLTSLMHSYGLSEDGAAEKVKRIPILHVYGQLGFFCWQTEAVDLNTGKTVEQGQLAVPYGRLKEEAPGSTTKVINAAAHGIRIISEERPDPPNVQLSDARDYLDKTERVIILGFGYDKTNVDRLDLQALRGREVYGSAFGFSDLERAEIAERCGIDKRRVGAGNWDALQFLRNTVVL
jgi:hypothetical protein